MTSEKEKLNQALYEMKRTAKQLYPLFNAINDEIDKLKEEDPNDPLTTKKTLKYLSENILELGGNLEDQAKFIEKSINHGI
ncbi:hypothetical protein MU859_05290 [Lactobacillus kefiranofaciens subsp. kefirgranum]|uniref:hypothetical protein n=1 Tax=Lactobacillus kefiranofaciens TaxID=267818 RepID=UPI002030A1DE|nr:hypothetical protein [Lactobacillus kefiranofaciens]MDF4142317.1 hypothetical protein [Lactobacillus kefiranofaciens]URW72297.1 hypothetical protein MU859_05290 [Lactobacillus kefiranofaciens subsp. kefirgranum]URW74228.1 hypothetical protein MU860_05175 [Lactobacillus kefiranofaciens subsp. kefirgranum]